jgi:NhaP-type Na+/H+ or K+/H+ antiporter
MHAVTTFNLVLASLIAIIALEVLAKRMRLPPAAALLVGGVAMAFVPGMPQVELGPELVLVNRRRGHDSDIAIARPIAIASLLDSQWSICRYSALLSSIRFIVLPMSKRL